MTERRTRRRPRTLLAVLAVALLAAGATAEEAGSEEEALAELLTLLEEETDLVTKTRMNSDFVPGIVTVLEGAELEELGVRTVWEALSLVPGLQPVRDRVGTGSVVVRGLGFPFNNGNVKVLLNSVGVSRESAGINASVLLFPIEQVERIEVIRGPGSVIYGDFAFMGLINVVTRRDGVRVHLTGDDRETVAGGVRYSWSADDRPLRVSVNAVASNHDDAELPAPRAGEEERLTGVIAAERGGFELTVQAVDREVESRAELPAPVRLETASETSWAAEAAYRRELSADLAVSARLGYQDNRVVGVATRFDGSLTHVAADLQWSGLDRHRWLVGVDYSASDVDRFSDRPGRARPMPPPGGPPPMPPSGGPPPMPPPGGPGLLLLRDVDREVVGLVLQDEIELGPAVTATLGARWDDYSDVGTRLTPRLALVWRISDRHIVKAQYAEGFRAPTYFELYDTDGSRFDLDFEVNETSELNYVYKRPGTVGRLTLFRGRLRDMIFRDPGTPAFENDRRARSEGVEAEWRQHLGRRFEVAANASWADTEDSRYDAAPPHRPSPTEPDLLANLALLYRPTGDLSLAARWNHVGGRASGTPGYDLVDLTATWRGLPAGWSLAAGVQNLADDEVLYVDPRPDGAIDVSRYGRRAVWARLSWSH